MKIKSKQDLMKPDVAKEVLERLNLSTIMIVDEMSDSAHILHNTDATPQFELVSIRGESKDNDSKKVLSKFIDAMGK